MTYLLVFLAALFGLGLFRGLASPRRSYDRNDDRDDYDYDCGGGGCDYDCRGDEPSDPA